MKTSGENLAGKILVGKRPRVEKAGRETPRGRRSRGKRPGGKVSITFRVTKNKTVIGLSLYERYYLVCKLINADKNV